MYSLKYYSNIVTLIIKFNNKKSSKNNENRNTVYNIEFPPSTVELKFSPLYSVHFENKVFHTVKNNKELRTQVISEFMQVKDD